MFWIVVPALLVLAFAAAWWASGRAQPGRRRHDRQVDVDRHLAETEQRSNTRMYPTNGPLAGG